MLVRRAWPSRRAPPQRCALARRAEPSTVLQGLPERAAWRRRERIQSKRGAPSRVRAQEGLVGMGVGVSRHEGEAGSSEDGATKH